MWETVQLEIKRIKDYMERNGVRQLDFSKVEDNPFIGRVICGSCGNVFGRKTWNSTDEKLKRQWNRRYEVKGEVRCKNKHIDEEILYKAFVSSFNALVENKEQYKVENCRWRWVRRYIAREFIDIIGDGELIKETDIDLYFKMIERMVVIEGDKIVVSYLDGFKESHDWLYLWFQSYDRIILSFLEIDKYIKDFFQYTRNAFDSIAQIINSALLANESINIEKVDFNKITTILNKKEYSSKFPKTLAWLLKVQQSEEFMYLVEFNNRTKHICDSKIIMSQNLLNYDVVNKLDPFYKKGKQFEEQDICVITKIVLDFIEDEFLSFLGVLTEEIELDTFIKGRIHNLKFYSQQIKDDPQSSFTVIYIEVEESIDELPDVLRILLVNNNQLISINSDYEEILVRDKNGKYLGQFIMDGSLVRDGLHLYRKYKKDNIEGIRAFINHSRKNNLVNPFFISGNVVRVGFDKTE